MLLSTVVLLPIHGLTSFPVGLPSTTGQSTTINTPLSFETNEGLADRAFDYVARARGYTVALSSARTVIAFARSELAMRFLGANEQSYGSAENQLHKHLSPLCLVPEAVTSHSRVEATPG